MLVVRAAGSSDLDGVLALVGGIGHGMTTLKADRAALARRLEIAAASFREQVAFAQRDYVFVLDDSGNARVAGICAIKGAVGLDEPFYNYRKGMIVHAAPSVDGFLRHELLYLSHDLTGSAELCSLYLHPDYRRGSNGKLLSKSRFMFIAQFPHLFPRQVHELRASRDGVLATLAGTAGPLGEVPEALVCNTDLTEFRVVASAVSMACGRFSIDAARQRLLGAGAGVVRAAPLAGRGAAPAHPLPSRGGDSSHSITEGQS